MLGDDRKYLAALFTLKVEIDLITGDTKDKIAPQAEILLRREGFLKEGESLGKASEAMVSTRVQEYIQSKVEVYNSAHSISRA